MELNAGHIAPADLGADLGEISATEALAVVLGELRRLGSRLEAQQQAMQQQAAEIDRLRRRIHDPASEEMTSEEAADHLGLSAYTVQEKARAWENGDRAGLRGYKINGRGGGEWRFLRSDVEAFKQRRKSVC